MKSGDQKKQKIFVLGLDCAAPELIFDRWKNDLPNLNRLVSQGLSGPLQSTIPPITIPAWTSMLTSRDPGSLGLYGFRNRRDRSYDRHFIANSEHVLYPRVWHHLSRNGIRCAVVGVPQTFPVRPLNGRLVSGFLTPGIQSDFTYPHSFRDEVLSVVPDYTFDVKEFRTEDKFFLLRQIHEMTEGHFRLIDHMLDQKVWDFFMSVEIGTDRIHHAFWHNFDKEHIHYLSGNPFENVIRDYYIRIDRQLGVWLSKLDSDCAVLIVSDHGAKRMDGGFCLNEWLRRNGYLVLKREPEQGTLIPFHEDLVDWEKTIAWGSGGYCGRVFLNVKGREPMGLVESSDFHKVREKIVSELVAVPECPETRVFRPEDEYREVRGIAPDLILYFGNLFWRSVGSFGHDGILTTKNDTGPDACNHAESGLFILLDPENPAGGRRIEDAHLMDVTPTILDLMGVDIPDGMQGRSWIK